MYKWIANPRLSVGQQMNEPFQEVNHKNEQVNLFSDYPALDTTCLVSVHTLGRPCHLQMVDVYGTIFPIHSKSWSTGTSWNTEPWTLL